MICIKPQDGVPATMDESKLRGFRVSANDAASRAAAAARGCFHCGLPIAAGALFSHESGGEWRVFCCPGCEVVSLSISGLGLDDYYRLRASPAPRPDRKSVV